jgi:hypothetical protein
MRFWWNSLRPSHTGDADLAEWNQLAGALFHYFARQDIHRVYVARIPRHAGPEAASGCPAVLGLLRSRRSGPVGGGAGKAARSRLCRPGISRVCTRSPSGANFGRSRGCRNALGRFSIRCIFLADGYRDGFYLSPLLLSSSPGDVTYLHPGWSTRANGPRWTLLPGSRRIRNRLHASQ